MKKILSALFILCFSAALATEFSDGLMDKIRELKGDNKTKSEEIRKEPKNKLPDNPEMTKRADRIIEEELPNILEQVDIFKSQIAKSTIGMDIDKNSCTEEAEGGSCWDDREDMKDLNLYVFISSSVPEGTLKKYAADMKKLPSAIMVMNGTIGGVDNIMPTIDLLARLSCGKNVNELMKTDTKCAMGRTDINPYLFRAFNVQAVPTFVYSEIPYDELMKAVTMGDKIKGRFLKLSGDTSLEYALTRFENEGVQAASLMKKQLKAGGFYGTP